MVDGYGGRVGQSPVAYYCWLSSINGLIFCYMLELFHHEFYQIYCALKVYFGWERRFLTAYAMVMWAFSKAPIAVVMAVRETSILFAILIGIFFLKEKITLPKIIGSSITLFGIFLLRAS